MDTPYWHAQPKIFPGLVHEQTRKTTMRSGSDLENHLAALAGEIDARDPGQRIRSVEDGEVGDDFGQAFEHTDSDSA